MVTAVIQCALGSGNCQHILLNGTRRVFAFRSRPCSSCHLPKKPRIALFIDADQSGRRALQPLLIALKERGTLVKRRAYLTDFLAKEWARDLQQCCVESVVVPRLSGGGKNPVDIEIALDVADCFHGDGCADVSGIAIASNDADFALILRRARKRGLAAFWAIHHEARELASSVRQIAEENQIELVHYSLPGGINRPRVIITLTDEGRSNFQFVDRPLEPQWYDDVETVRNLLTKLGYWNEEWQSPLIHAIAKFFSINRLGHIDVYPVWRGVIQAQAAISNANKAPFKNNPQDLVYVEPAGGIRAGSRVTKMAGSNRAATLISGGGPFLVKVSRNLVQDILHHMGYLEPAGSFKEAVRLFCEVNSSSLAKLFVVPGSNAIEQQKRLHDVFATESICQRWKVPPADTGIRRRLLSKGYIESEDVCREKVQAAIIRYMKHLGDPLPPKCSYLAAVLHAAQYEARKNPNFRK